MQKTTQLYEGKAKKVYATDDENLVIVDYKDDATAFKNIKKGTISGKGVINNRVTNYLMQLLEKNGFVVRESVEWDARLKKIVPTEKAEGVREEILSNISSMEKILKQGISKEDMKICKNVLAQMSENLLGNEKKSRGEEIKDHE